MIKFVKSLELEMKYGPLPIKRIRHCYKGIFTYILYQVISGKFKGELYCRRDNARSHSSIYIRPESFPKIFNKH